MLQNLLIKPAADSCGGAEDYILLLLFYWGPGVKLTLIMERGYKKFVMTLQLSQLCLSWPNGVYLTVDLEVKKTIIGKLQTNI
jgi:hypothetical protein